MRSILAALALATALPLEAAPAVFSGDTLTVDEVLVQRPGGPALYGNVEFTRRADGNFIVAAFDELPLADVQSITVERDQYPPGTVVVVVQGYKSLPCIDVAPATVSRVGNTFHFALVELPPPDNVRCIAQIEPIMEAFGLQTGELAPGDYDIVYGDLKVSFTLHPAR